MAFLGVQAFSYGCFGDTQMKTSRFIVGVALSGIALALPMATRAAGFTNGSFETVTGGFNPGAGSYTEPGAGNTDITGWVVTSGNVDIVNTSYFSPDFIASDGQNSIDLNGSQPGAIAQTFTTVAGGHYQVTFDLNSNVYDGDPNAIKNVLVSAGADSAVFSYANALHPIHQGGPWQGHTFDFTATGAATTLSFQSLVTNCCWGAELDNVAVSQLTGGVPEPATWALMLLGFGGLGATLRRRRGQVALAA